MRNPTFDIMKGIGIIAMIVGHCPLPYSLSHFIYAWHMPLFFFISGYFYKHKSFKEQLNKSSRALVLPYFATAMLMILIAAIVGLFIEWKDVSHIFISMLVAGSGASVPILQEYSIGCIWFLLALFWCRIFYNYIDCIKLNIVKCGGGVVALFLLTIFASKFIYIPTQVLAGANSVLFFAIGQLVKQRSIPERYSLLLVVIAIVLLIYSSYIGALEMARCWYSSVVINIIGALSGIYLVYKFSGLISKCKCGEWVAKLGQITILILAVHKLEGFISFGSHISTLIFPSDGKEQMLLLIILRVAIALSISLLIYRNKFIKLIYFNKR